MTICNRSFTAHSPARTVLALALSLASCEGRRAPSQPAAKMQAEAAVNALRARLAGTEVGARLAGVPSSVGPVGTAAVGPRSWRVEDRASTRVHLPERATAPFRIEEAKSGLAAEVVVLGARDVEAQAAQNYLVYPGAHASGATLFHRKLPAGIEDLLSFHERPPTARVEYQLALGDRVRGLRLVANTLELLDGAGAPRLRISPPFLVGADGARTTAALAVSGCAVDTNPAPPWGRKPIAPGATSCAVSVTWKGDAVAYPAVLDPLWTTTGSMSASRQDHTATVLATGLVLVVGGRDSPTGTTGLDTAELYDPASGT